MRARGRAASRPASSGGCFGEAHPRVRSRRGAVLGGRHGRHAGAAEPGRGGPASSAARPAAGKVPVAQGLTRAILRGAHPAGQTPDDKPERLSFVLRPVTWPGSRHRWPRACPAAR